MKSYELVTIAPQVERLETRVISVSCDLCGTWITQLRANGVSILNPELKLHFGSALDVKVEMKAGEHNLDGGAGETTSFDLCPGCFEDRLKPWLEGQGAEARVEAWGE